LESSLHNFKAYIEPNYELYNYINNLDNLRVSCSNETPSSDSLAIWNPVYKIY